MKRYFYIFQLFSFLAIYSLHAQGFETFANFPETANTYKDGTFVGQDGSTWTYTQCRGDILITDETPTLGKDRTTNASIESGNISNGIGVINFDYMQAFSTNVNLQVFANDILVGTVASSGEKDIVKNSGDIIVNQGGEVIIKFYQPSGAGQVAIDNVSWTNYTAAIEEEPSNHVTDFSIGKITSYSLQLNWTGATGDQLPSRYLILGKIGNKAFATVQDTVPVANDTEWSDSTFAINITHKDGPDSINISGLDEFTTYDFKIYSYTNFGTNIDYKTDGDVPETSGTTAGLVLTPISTIRQGDYEGQIVKVSGTVTYKVSSGFYLQDAVAPWSGINVYDGSASSYFHIADTVVIVGTVADYNGLAEITDLASWTIVSSDADMPRPLVVSTGDFAQEQYESMLIQVKDAECTAAQVYYDEWEVNDGSGACIIDDYFYTFVPIVGAKYNVTGISNYYNSFKLAPRSEADIELITNAPVITDIGVSVKVPLADQAFVDTVKIKAKSELVAARLYYVINGEETEKDSVNMMSLLGDSIYYAEIPESAYVDADAIKYWVYAEDMEGEKTEGTLHGFFAGLTPIDNFKQWQDESELFYEGYYVRTSGVATVADSVFSKTSMNFYIQDEEFDAVNIFGPGGGAVDIFPGHQYTVIGMITQYAGIMEVMPDNPVTDLIDDGDVGMPDPVELTMSELLSFGSELESLLIKILNVDTVASENNDPWPLTNESNANIMISDDGGTNQLILHLDKDTDIPGRSQPIWPQHITGIFGQYDETTPYTEGYQLIPRSINDFETPTAIEDLSTVIPDELILYPAYPNPFNPAATIPFNIPVDLVGEQIKKLTIYNTLGQIVKEYTLSNIKAGLNMVKWNGRSNEGNQVSSGLYFAVLQVSNLRQSLKLLLLK